MLQFVYPLYESFELYVVILSDKDLEMKMLNHRVDICLIFF